MGLVGKYKYIIDMYKSGRDLKEKDYVYGFVKKNMVDENSQ